MAEQTPFATPDDEDIYGEYLEHPQVRALVSAYERIETQDQTTNTRSRYSRIFGEFMLLDEAHNLMMKEVHKLARGARKNPAAIGLVAVGSLGLAAGTGVAYLRSRTRH